MYFIILYKDVLYNNWFSKIGMPNDGQFLLQASRILDIKKLRFGQYGYGSSSYGSSDSFGGSDSAPQYKCKSRENKCLSKCQKAPKQG